MVTDFTPDPRPIVYLGFGTGNFANFSETNPGLSAAWNDCDDDGDVPGVSGEPGAWASNGVPDAFDWLLDRLETRYDEGWRRMCLYLPAGRVGSYDRMAEPKGTQQPGGSAQWWTLPAWKRDGFDEDIADWIDEKAGLSDPVFLSVYVGYGLTHPCTLCMDDCASNCIDYFVNCTDATAAVDPDPTSAAHMCIMKMNVQPWIDVGFTEYAFDHSSGAPDDLRALQALDDYDGIIKLIGEAVPKTNCSGTPPTYDIDDAAIAAMAWTGTPEFYEAHEWVRTGCGTSSTELPIPTPGQHELGVFLQHTAVTVDRELIHKYVGQNFVAWAPASNHSSMLDYTMQAYGTRFFPGVTIPSPGIADVNGDDTLDMVDLAIVIANASSSGNWVTRAHGDLDADGDVDGTDEDICDCEVMNGEGSWDFGSGMCDP